MPVRRFAASSDLLGGVGFPSTAFSYRPANLLPGDEVVLMVRQVGPDGVVEGIQLHRRPGGRVPPAPSEDPESVDPWHERANALQDWEDRGIPLPERYDIRRRMRPLRTTHEDHRRLRNAAEAEAAARDRLYKLVEEMKARKP